MKIGCVDVDGHNWPNLCLMKLSAYHKARGDTVELWRPEGWYDLVYEYLTETHGLEPEEVDYLLSLNDPLQAVADKWMERMGDLSDFSFALDDLFRHMETQEKKSVLGKLREKAAEPSKPSAPAREQEVR